MCLSPIKIKNPKLEISLAGGAPYYIEVPCGDCAECKKAKQDEWYFRTYYEAQSTFDKGGYVLFDTLTYKDSELPHVSEFVSIDPKYDVSCFDVEDYRYFFVRLRRQLEYYGFGHSNLKYFLTSEYGSSENGTHRPHYHILFFVVPDENGRMIDWYSLSKLINKCWNKGRTDGYPYKPMMYIAKHVFGQGHNEDKLHMQTVCMYVSKYITKDSFFQKIVDQRLYNVFKEKYLREGFNLEEGMNIDDILYYLGEDEIDRYKKLKKNMNQFHRQSKGFGEDWLKYNNYDEVFKTGMISMPDKNNIVKHIPIPSYYQMKIWYDLVKVNGKAVRWELNEEGTKYKFSHILQSVERMADKIDDWCKMMRDHNYYCDLEGEERDKWYDSIIKKFDSINKDRDLQQFSVYLLFYKGRLKDPAWYKRTIDNLYSEENKNFATDPIEFWMIEHDPLLKYQKSLEAFNNEGRNVLYGYNHASYKKVFGCKFVSKKNLGNTIEWKDEGYKGLVRLWIEYMGQFKLSNGFTPSLLKVDRKTFDAIDSDGIEMSLRVVSDKDDPNFEGYDEMFRLYCKGQEFKNEFKQEGHDNLERVKRVFKDSFNKNI